MNEKIKTRKRKSKNKSKSKNDKPSRRGRPFAADYLPFEEAVKTVRKELLASSVQYYKWWDRNRPANLPRRPDNTYKNEWAGWGYYIGKTNSFGSSREGRDTTKSRHNYRPLEEIRKYAALHGIKTQQEWFDHVREKGLPDDIPTRPDIVFSPTRRGRANNPFKPKTLGWVSWGNFLELSRSVQLIEDKIEIIRPILYIATSPSQINGVYLINVIGGDVYELKRHIINMGVRLIKAFYTDVMAEHKPIINQLNNYIYGQSDEYLIHNIWDVVNALEEKLEVVRFN